MQNKPKSKDISESDYVNWYGGIEYGFYNPRIEDFEFTSCRAHNVWALMAYMQGTANFEEYCFQDKNSVTIHLGGFKTEYLEKLKAEFRKLEVKFRLRPTKFILTKSKNNKDIIKVESTKFWIKSVQIYSLFLLLLRSAESDFLIGEDKGLKRYYRDIAPHIPELITLTKNHTQEFGWSTKFKHNMNERGWDNQCHDYGIGEFFHPREYNDNYTKNFVTFGELKKYVENKKLKKVLDKAA